MNRREILAGILALPFVGLLRGLVRVEPEKTLEDVPRLGSLIVEPGAEIGLREVACHKGPWPDPFWWDRSRWRDGRLPKDGDTIVFPTEGLPYVEAPKT